MDMKNLLNKLNGLLAENEEEQGMSESPMGRATSDTKMKAKKCAFCGGNFVSGGKTTEKGDTICKDCDDYYAFDGPGGEEPGISESPMGRRATAEPHTCETCGRSMPNWEPSDSAECDECAEGMSPEDSDPDKLDEATMCEDCGASPCVCEDPLAEKKLTGAEKRKRETLVKGMKGADWEERYPGRGEEVMYATATKKAKELAETEETDNFKGTDECVSDCWDNEKHSPLCPHYTDLAESEEVEEAKTCQCEGECKCKDNQLDEIRQLAGLMECGEMWDAPVSQAPAVDLQQSKMTVTTSMDSEAGTKQVTVTAEGDGADELMRVLQMAGINVAPTANTVVDEYANDPDAKALDHKSMLIDLSGGINAPHGQYNPDRARDNSMAMVGEAVDQLAARLKAKFNSQK